MSPNLDARNEFLETGHFGPIQVLSERDCRVLFDIAMRTANSPVNVWRKSLATSSRAIYELAKHPKIMNIVTSIIGDDVMLWGASVERRRPGAIHPWHTDIETALSNEHTISVWLGIRNVSSNSALSFVPYSHLFGVTVQEERMIRRVKRDQARSSDIHKWARARNPRSGVITAAPSVGDAVFIHGRLWHGSQNTSDRTRCALLLQYATPCTPIRIPDYEHLDWPFVYQRQPKPPCLMLRGSTRTMKNHFVAPPPPANEKRHIRLSTYTKTLELPLESDEESGWKSYHLFKGTTANHKFIGCHVSSLKTGATPHPPHRHKQEEILIMLDGQADLILPDNLHSGGSDRVRLSPGQFAYYPAGFSHTLTTVSAEPANYLMFRWFTKHLEYESRLEHGIYNIKDSVHGASVPDGFHTRRLFGNRTDCLSKLHCHVSTLTPGSGYDSHIDAHDVAIIVLDGEIETLGCAYGSNSVIYFAAGELHDMWNRRDRVARYLVFEFHGHNGSPISIYRDRFRKLARRCMGLGRRLAGLTRANLNYRRLGSE